MSSEHKSGAERRLNPRFLINRSIDVLGLDKLGFQVCMLIDISLGGARIRSRVKYSPSHALTVRVNLYDGSKTLDLPGLILRVNELPDGWYEYGILFTNLTYEQKFALAGDIAFIARCK